MAPDDQTIPFALPDIGQEEIDEVVDTLKSGWLTTGPKTKKFEDAFGRFVGAAHALAVNSGTAALHLGLDAMGVGPGDEVITTPYTFTATAEVVRYLGAKAVFADIDPATLTLDPSNIERLVTPRTKAVIPVHFAGCACDMDPILDIARKHHLGVLEDAAHAFPCTYKGRMVGSLGDATAFSFYVTKTLATGEGGMLTTDSDEIADRVRVMRLHGISRDIWNRYRGKKPNWYYEVIAAGYKYNMTDLAAAIGIHQLAKAEAFRRRREQIAAAYSEAFADTPLALPQHPRPDDLHAWHLYVVRIESGSGIRRDRFIEKLFEQGVGASVHFIPLHIQPFWKNLYGLEPQDFPKALAAYEQAASLPIYSRMTDGEVQRVIDAVRNIFR